MSGFLRRVLRFLRDIVYATTIPSRIYALKLMGRARRAKSITDLVIIAFNVRMPLLRWMNVRPSQVYWVYPTWIAVDSYS